MHFFIVHFTKFMHSSTCPLFCCWLDQHPTCSIFSLWQIFLNLSEINVVTVFEIISLGNPCSENTDSLHATRLSAELLGICWSIPRYKRKLLLSYYNSTPITSNGLPGSSWRIILRLWQINSKHSVVFNCIFYVTIHVDPVYWLPG